MKFFNIMIITFFFIVICVPSIIVLAFDTKEKNPKLGAEYPVIATVSKTNEMEVTVYRMNDKATETMTLENYVKGVLASEMPASFELEALKAQAISARTFIIKTLLTKNIKNLPLQADITDSTLEQVYKNDDELKAMWKNDDYEKNLKRVTQAVNETLGLILTYNGEPVDASFFAISNGYTINSEDYWTTSIPYLRSVPSPWDLTSPKLFETKIISIDEVEKELGVKIPSNGEIGKVQKSSNGRVTNIEISGKKFSGREVREALGLKSTDFVFKRIGDEIEVTTKGYGHGVGMSQYGANGMALEGKNYIDILKYYYQGVEIEDIKSNQDYNKLSEKRNEV
jgi:stage II sporulation protein D